MGQKEREAAAWWAEFGDRADYDDPEPPVSEPAAPKRPCRLCLSPSISDYCTTCRKPEGPYDARVRTR